MNFNLETAIKSWRSGLRKHQGFEDADIDELEDHLRAKVEELVSNGSAIWDAFDAAIKEDYQDIPSISSQFTEQRSDSSLLPALLRNYLKVGLRSFGRTKTYFSINLVGLVIGLTSVLYIVFYVNHELSYDSFHGNSNQLYRVNMHVERASGQINYPIIPPAFGPAIQETFPEVENVARLRYAYNVLMKNQNQSFYEEKVFFAEPAFLEMFSFKWLQGEQKNALSEVNSVVLTKSTAEKYFGNADPLGHVITFNNEIDLQVIGIIEDVPEHSHFSFDFLISFETFQPGPGSLEPMTSWRWLGFLTYVQLAPNADPPELEKGLAELFLANNNASNNRKVEIGLQSLPDIYLNSGDLSNPQGGLFKVNDKENLVSLSIVALLIITISFFNYFNITSALMRTRTKEIGIRKVFGSSKRKVFIQMGSETFMIVIFAAVLSWLLLLIVGQSGSLPIRGESALIAGLLSVGIILGFTLLSSVLFGSSFSTYSAIALLREKFTNVSRSPLSVGRLVLLLQFGISTSLIMISFIVISQLNFFSKKDLGYEKNGMLIAQFRSEEMHTRRQTFVDRVMSLPQVKHVSFGPSLDGSTSGSPLRLREWPEDEVVQTAYFGVDYQFKNVLGLEVLEGRYFSKDHATDSIDAILINETLAELLGVDQPIGKKVAFTNSEYEIIGIFKDFHYKSLHHEIGPMALQMSLGQSRNVIIKYQTENVREALVDIENTWQEVFNDGAFPFDYLFLDEQLQAMYNKEAEFSSLLKIFTSLAIFLSVLGLFGLSSINIQKQIKQIGIRRVLGAGVKQIAEVVCKRYLVTAVVGILLFLPLAYFFMTQWLENFAYSIRLNISFPLLTLFIVLAIAIVTLGFQVYRVMVVNPSTILKDE